MFSDLLSLNLSANVVQAMIRISHAPRHPTTLAPSPYPLVAFFVAFPHTGPVITDIVNLRLNPLTS